MDGKYSGFTLIELIVVMVIAVILIAIALPNYSDQIKKGRRSEATSTLLSIIVAQEQYRMKNTSYGTLANVWGGVSVTSGGYYDLSITNITATGYVVTATAVASKGQATDDEAGVICNPLSITVNGLSTTKAPAACW